MLSQMQSSALFKALAEKHNQQVTEIQRKRDDLIRIQNEIKDKMTELPKHMINVDGAATRPVFATSGDPYNNPHHARHMFVYGSPRANVIHMQPAGGAANNSEANLIDMRPQFDQYAKLYVPPKPITIRMRSPPPVDIRHIDDSKTEENAKIAERYQQQMLDYYKDYNAAIERGFERNLAYEKERNETQQTQKKDESLVPFLKEELEKNRQTSEKNFNKLSNYIVELNRTLELDRERRRKEQKEQFEKEEKERKISQQRVTISTQARPERETSSTQVSLIDEARMRSFAHRSAYVAGMGPVNPSGFVSGHAIYDMGAVNVGSMGGQAGGPGVQMLGSGNDGDVVIAGASSHNCDGRIVTLKKSGVVTHTHDNPYVQSIISEIRQELDDIDRERRRQLIKERTKSAEQHVDKMLADLALEKERLCREVVSLARVNALLHTEGSGKSSLDPASTTAVADVLQLIKDQLRRVCKIQSEANLVRHETVMTHLKTLWSHSDSHTVVEAAPQNPPQRIPAPIVPAPIPIDPPTYGLLPAMVMFYDYVCGIPNESLTSVVLNTSVVRRTCGRNNEEIIDLLVDMGEIPPAGVSHASRVLDGVQPPGISSLPLESRGVAMLRYKHDLPQQFPADPNLFAMVTLGGQQTHVTSKTHGFARCLIPLVRQNDVSEHPATGRFVSEFHSHSNLFSHASLYYRLVRLEDAEAELRTWPVSLGRMNLYMPVQMPGTMVNENGYGEDEPADLLRT